jgi:hypothetical protein
MTHNIVTNDEAVTGSNIFVVAIFGTFEWHVTNFRGTFVENVKKVKNQPTRPCIDFWKLNDMQQVLFFLIFKIPSFNYYKPIIVVVNRLFQL